MVLRVSAHVGQEQKGDTVTSVLRDSGTTLLLGVKVTILSYTGGMGGVRLMHLYQWFNNCLPVLWQPVSVKMMEPLPVTESPADASVSQGWLELDVTGAFPDTS